MVLNKNGSGFHRLENENRKYFLWSEIGSGHRKTSTPVMLSCLGTVLSASYFNFSIC